MEHILEHIPMDEAMKQNLKNQYQKPFKRNISVLTISLLLVYTAIVMGQLFLKDANTEMNYTPVVMLTIGFVLVFFMAYPKFKKANIHYKHDAELGMIAKERVIVTKVFPTPVGINIYWVSSDSIKTFTPDPYRIFQEGDVVVIYYLKFSKEYLAYGI